MWEDGDEIALGAIAACPGLGGLDHAVCPFQDALVDSGIEAAKDALPVALDRIGGLFDGLQPAVGCPKVPLLQGPLP